MASLWQYGKRARPRGEGFYNFPSALITIKPACFVSPSLFYFMLADAVYFVLALFLALEKKGEGLPIVVTLNVPVKQAIRGSSQKEKKTTRPASI